MMVADLDHVVWLQLASWRTRRGLLRVLYHTKIARFIYPIPQSQILQVFRSDDPGIRGGGQERHPAHQGAEGVSQAPERIEVVPFRCRRSARFIVPVDSKIFSCLAIFIRIRGEAMGNCLLW